MSNTTPWGMLQSSSQIATGIRWVTTLGGHGGVLLSRKRNQQITAEMRATDGAYEQRNGWAIPVIHFAHEFADYFDRLSPSDGRRRYIKALRIVRETLPDAWAAWASAYFDDPDPDIAINGLQSIEIEGSACEEDPRRSPFTGDIVHPWNPDDITFFTVYTRSTAGFANCVGDFVQLPLAVAFAERLAAASGAPIRVGQALRRPEARACGQCRSDPVGRVIQHAGPSVLQLYERPRCNDQRIGPPCIVCDGASVSRVRPEALACGVCGDCGKRIVKAIGGADAAAIRSDGCNAGRY